jgi:hypothetical protein
MILQRTSHSTRIRLRKTDKSPIYALVSSSFTTAELNFMSWNKIYSIFPRTTIAHHKFYPLRSLDDDFGSVLVELAQQGWTSRDLVWPDLTKDEPHGIGPRRVGDHFSLVMPLPSISTRCQVAFTPDYVLELVKFDVCDDPPRPVSSRGFGNQTSIVRPRDRKLYIQVEELTSPALRYRYTTGSGISTDSWRVYVVQRLERWTLIEYLKMDDAGRLGELTHRPYGYPTVSLPSEFQVPATWDYADDQMPLWHQDWVQKGKK